MDHIPSNAVSWITIRNYGFSDATEIFVFISGYTAAFVYGRAMQEHGFIVASARVLKRAWQIYIAHVFLLAIYLAEIAYVANSFDNPLYSEEMGVLDFLKNPDVTILQALLLKFKPVNMDVLPLYILLLAWFPPMLWLLLRAPSIALLSSATLYALMWFFEWNIPAYPTGTWVFNPFAWQLLFVFGAWCALGGAQNLSRGRIHKSWWGSPSPISCLHSDHNDLVFPAAGGFGAEICQRRDLPDRQDQSRRAAHFAFFVAGRHNGRVRAARLAGAQVADLLAGDRVRTAFTGDILPRSVSAPSPATSFSPKSPTACSAYRGQPCRHRHHGWSGGPDFVV